MSDKGWGPIVLFDKVKVHWGLTDEEAKRILPDHTNHERLRAVLRIAADVNALFMDGEAEREWLRTPGPHMAVSPLSAMMSEVDDDVFRVKQLAALLSGR